MFFSENCDHDLRMRYMRRFRFLMKRLVKSTWGSRQAGKVSEGMFDYVPNESEGLYMVGEAIC